MNALKNTVILLRFPFSVYLLPVFLFAISQGSQLDIPKTILVFIILHIIIYPSSNGYNSYIDQDTESIGGLEKPPIPPRLLFYVTWIMDAIGVVMSFLVINVTFGTMVLGYVLASRAYSSKTIRLKQYPIISFLIVFLFQGGYTFIMVLAGSTSMGILNILDTPLVMAALVSSLMIGGGYPLTQIYQHDADAENGDKTLSMLLNLKGTFLFSILLFVLAAILLFVYFIGQQNISHFLMFQLFITPLLVWFIVWMRRVWKNSEQANFKNTMTMNNISALCLNLFYGTLVIINHIIEIS